ncbi:MAG: hypothetical protein ACK55X_06505 [Synechococcaceae cyanobacterium]|jgi:hypothetical protein
MPLLSLLAVAIVLGLLWARQSGSLLAPPATPGAPTAAPAQPPAATVRQAEQAIDAASQAEQRRLDDAMKGLTPGSGP